MLKRRIIAVRPFHMANFSSGAFYNVIGTFLVVLIVTPITFMLISALLLIGTLTTPYVKERPKELEYSRVKTHLNTRIFPAYLAVFVMLFALLAFLLTLFEVRTTIVDYVLLVCLVGIVVLGSYVALSLFAWHMNREDRLNRNNWIGETLVCGIPILVGGILLLLTSTFSISTFGPDTSGICVSALVIAGVIIAAVLFATVRFTAIAKKVQQPELQTNFTQNQHCQYGIPCQCETCQLHHQQYPPFGRSDSGQ